MQRVKEIMYIQKVILDEIKELEEIEKTLGDEAFDIDRHGDLCFWLVNLDLELKELQTPLTDDELSKIRSVYSRAPYLLFEIDEGS